MIAESDSSGDVVKRYYYASYGKTLETAQNNTPGYTGHVYDDDLGLNYMKARYYDPEIGRFYSNDPVGFSSSNLFSFNRYTYANNNPYKFVDPDGKLPIVVIAIWILKEAGGEVFEQVTGVPAPTIKNLGKAAAKQIMRKTLKGRPKVSGVYDFDETDARYIGKGKDVLKRLTQQASGKKPKLTEKNVHSLKVKTIESDNPKLLQYTEQKRINMFTGPTEAHNSLKVTNKIPAMNKKKFDAYKVPNGK